MAALCRLEASATPEIRTAPQIAVLDTVNGEVVTRRLEHENGEARAFYASLAKPAWVGIETTGGTQWFERRRAELGHDT